MSKLFEIAIKGNEKEEKWKVDRKKKKERKEKKKCG